MEKRRKLLFLAGLALVVAALSLAVYSNAGAINIVSTHTTPGAITNTECLSCHDNILVETSPANPNTNPVLSAHKRHVMSVFLNFANNYATGLGGATNNYGCVKCHSGSDIANDGGVSTAIRKHVDPQVCLTCHGKFITAPTGSPAAHTDGASTVDKTNPRGCSPLGDAAGTCHGATAPGTQSPVVAHAGRNWINTTYASSGNYCLKCHGAHTWYLPDETNP